MTNTREERVALIKQLEALSDNDREYGHIERANTLEQAARALGEPSPDVWEAIDYEELSIRHGREVIVTFKDMKAAFDLFNELKARGIPDPPKVTVEEDRA